MNYWDKKNEIIKRCWAINNAVELAGGEAEPDLKKAIKKWYKYFYDMHSDWDLEILAEEEAKNNLDIGNGVEAEHKPWEASSLNDDKIQEEGQDEIDKKKMGI